MAFLSVRKFLEIPYTNALRQSCESVRTLYIAANEMDFDIAFAAYMQTSPLVRQKFCRFSIGRKFLLYGNRL
jgi:hypothetical protein